MPKMPALVLSASRKCMTEYTQNNFKEFHKYTALTAHSAYQCILTFLGTCPT